MMSCPLSNKKNYAAGNFMADEVKDINNTITSRRLIILMILTIRSYLTSFPAVIYSSTDIILNDPGCMMLMRLIIS